MRIALAGFGVVGKALAELLAKAGPELRARYGLMPRLVAVRDGRSSALDPAGLDPLALLSAKAQTGAVGLLVAQPTDPPHWARTTPADVYIDTTPTDLHHPRPAIEALLSALGSGKNVISANKAPLAVAMPALLEAARHNKRRLCFSAAVGAGTPVLATARTLSHGDRITAVQAILNGTTNFILWLMATSHTSFDEALAQAQRLGYAEADPSNDVDGFDTAMKLVILANHAVEIPASVQSVDIKGIRAVTSEDISTAASESRVIKLIASIDDAGTLAVAPTSIPSDDTLNVPRNLNAVRFTLASGNQPTLIGRGAGGPETATAILRDMIDLHTHA